MGKCLTCNNGDVFGDWTVIDNTPIVKKGHVYVKVKCKCGKEEEKCLSDLRNGRTSSCRNCASQKNSYLVKIGDVYKNWKVIAGPSYENKRHNRMYKARCLKCGKHERWFTASELTNPNVSKCCCHCTGKERSETLQKNNGKIGDLCKGQVGRIEQNAKVRGIEFNLTIKYLWELFQKQKQICAITGEFIPNIKQASLDRIDSSKGYIEGNVQWVTIQANLSKHTMTMDQLYEFCEKVLKFRDEKNKNLNKDNQQPLNDSSGSETNSTEYPSSDLNKNKSDG